jgi:hypothetical protein
MNRSRGGKCTRMRRSRQERKRSGRRGKVTMKSRGGKGMRRIREREREKGMKSSRGRKNNAKVGGGEE